MAITLKESGSGYDAVPAGTYQAVCSGVWDIGKQRQDFQGEVKYPHQIIVRFELNKTISGGEYDGKRYTLNKFYTASLHEKATLRKDLESWRGRAFTKEELEGFDVEKLIGANCLLSVVHTDKGKAKIATISAIMDGMTKMVPELEPATPGWVQKFIDRKVQDDKVMELMTPPADNDSSDVPF